MDDTVLVSGFPRPATSPMMRMLEAGGLTVLCDHVRQADEDNPQGYYEFDPVKRTSEDPSWLDAAGKAAARAGFHAGHVSAIRGTDETKSLP